MKLKHNIGIVLNAENSISRLPPVGSIKGDIVSDVAEWKQNGEGQC
jgi:hypothetical protein